MVKISRYLHVGPGGMNCTCCFPAPRSKDRRKQWRRAKRRSDREAMRNAMADLVDDNWMELEELNAEYEKAYGPYGSAFDDWSDYHNEQDLSLQKEDADWDWIPVVAAHCVRQGRATGATFRAPTVESRTG